MSKYAIYAFLACLILFSLGIYLTYQKGYQAGQDSEKTAQQKAMDDARSENAKLLRKITERSKDRVIHNSECGDIIGVRKEYNR